jgi:hypothetical protein
MDLMSVGFDNLFQKYFVAVSVSRPDMPDLVTEITISRAVGVSSM